MALPAIHDPGTSTADDSNPTHTKTPTSLLLSLPREIHNEICTYLLSAGDLAILRTSKQLGHEAGERLYREGVCRIKIGVPNGGAEDSSFPQEWKNFQNFHFHFFLGPESTLAFYPTFWQFERFANLNQTDLKRDCLITFEYGRYDPIYPIRDDLYRMKDLLEQIASLTALATVAVMLASKQFERWNHPVHKVQCDLIDGQTKMDK